MMDEIDSLSRFFCSEVGLRFLLKAIITIKIIPSVKKSIRLNFHHSVVSLEKMCPQSCDDTKRDRSTELTYKYKHVPFAKTQPYSTFWAGLG